jgi:hypothetical protein
MCWTIHGCLGSSLSFIRFACSFTSSLQKTGYNAVAEAQSMLDVYNKAYAALTQDGRPNAFRDFLLSAPSMFSELGERLGAIQHINSFWSYRFPKRQPKTILPEELMDLLLDFEDSLAISKQDA